ncbi:restriction endonuclease subunit S [Pasteurella multocida]|nr:restriction endonuclease subunit S [Pasteurella multocida]MDY0576857.1 restriction endonuclease subunit S [Pasteurella multocida]
MSSWKKSKLTDVIDIIGGGPPKRSCDEYWNGDIPWLSVVDFNNGMRFVSKSAETITQLGLEKSSTKLLEANDLIISARGTVGCLAQLSIPMAFNQSCYGLRGKRGVIDNSFLYYFLKNNINELKQITHGAVFDTITRDTFEQIDITYPCVEKQIELANFLGNHDQKIQLNTQTNQTLEQIAQAIFKSWFVDFDPVKAKVDVLANGGSQADAERAAMQVISGKTDAELTQMQHTQPDAYKNLEKTTALFPSEMVESELGSVPKGWGVKALDEIAHYQNGLALQKFRPENEFLPVVKIAELKKGYADGSEKASVNIKPECIIDNGDVIFSWSGSLVVDFWCGGKAALNQHLFKVTSDNHPKWFYYLYTKHHLAEFQRIAQDKAVTMGHIKREHLSKAFCVVPDKLFLSEIKMFENLLSQVINNRLENFNLQEVRDGLLPKLLSGELEV